MDGAELMFARTLTRDERGNTLIELALVLPVFFTLVFGFIYFAMVLFQFGNLTFASRAAMRYACLHSSANAVPTGQADVNRIVAPMIYAYPPSTAAATLSYSGGNVVGGTVTVTVATAFQTGFTLQSTASGVIIQ